MLNTIACTLFSLTSFSVIALEEYAEFNAAFLRGNSVKEIIDVRRFSYGNPIPAGEYLSDIYLNDKFIGRANLKFVQHPNKSVALCADDTLFSLLDLDDSAIHSFDDTDGCIFFEKAVPEAKIAFNLSELRLDIKIAQAYIKHHPQGYIAPAQWQDGVPVAFVRYDASYYRYRYSNITSQQAYLGIDSGINIGGWALRHRGSQSWQQQRRLPYETIETYAQHEIANLRGQFILGDFFTSGQLLESFGVRGVQLSSDDRMLASSVRGYAPVIRGVANSNAQVKIYQNGSLLKDISVPAGPFVIDDLYPTGYGGDIEVEIIEANGEKRVFRVPYTATAQLIRQGYSRYQITAGRYRYGNELFKDKVVQATLQYGLTNNVTLNLGGIFNKNYNAELVGLAFNTPIGAFATNITWANAFFINGQQKRKGYSFYASYNTRVEQTNTNITLAAYRYFSRNYYSLQDTLRANRSVAVNADVIDLGVYADRLKNQFQLSINQHLPNSLGYFYLFGSTGTYWESKARHQEYQVGYSNQYKKINYSFSFSSAKTQLGKKDKRFYINVSLPLGGEFASPQLSQTINIHQGEAAKHQMMLSGILGKKYNYNLTVSKQGKTTNLSVNNSYYGSVGRLNASWGQDNRHNRQWSVGMSGAVVAHPKGITLANDLGDTFAIIHADGAMGATINNSIGNQLDYFGNGIVPYVEPYSINYIGINIDDLPDTVELSATEQQIIPKANSANLVNFSSIIGKVAFLDLGVNTGGKKPPIGTTVFDEEGKNVGTVAQGGKIYTRGLKNTGQLHLEWDNNQCRIDYHLPKQEDNQTVFLPVKCR
ncbi:fimbria/pilus outer membrane usher protein [Avibacterium paragallinarum]|uniref:Fimbrial biogenesis outer membrane usher protein n=1 Tax=Avibacterium paragallinarum TaxID=728 RepID=A0ABU7QJ16_AVIPA|nr:fimbria/pilus outer membrane usher protein [Avibacterium paragallinarum]MEE3608877.1 fimbria/pilus outer membrane usher protein [Avibacterium paragallinarum]MEE3622051.1 fimbria/pilus outer membrane usher protein [Avibacterium paragallinarum]MEE3669879.1 fimbria/pilus outer membrane usher protein [Avibacterium paragallinarum]MEE3680702.1 fimbria/pilus outer membrane usher protein [Avibacterium paragallinarum]MEE4386058.1 fimbria/pilus outer membrane usher protein [Avibacterium paragallinaru